jgi:hypothetical protein
LEFLNNATRWSSELKGLSWILRIHLNQGWGIAVRWTPKKIAEKLQKIAEKLWFQVREIVVWN